MVILAIGMGMLMTALAVAIGGLALKLVLILMSRSLMSRSLTAAGAESELGVAPPVIQFKASDKSRGTMEWAEEAAA